MSYRFETLQLHAGLAPDAVTGARAVPIYQSSAFVFPSTEHAEARFALKDPGPIYSRLGNPTVEVLENRVAALEGGTAAVATASGMAAITEALLTFLKAGDEIVSSATIYGGTHSLFVDTLPRLGIRTVFTDGNTPEDFGKALTEHTKCIYVEAIGNPNADLVDLEAVAEIARRRGIPLVVDSTFATPYLLRPFEHGADIVIHSATKYLGGHGTTVGGIAVDGGTFDWANGNFPEFTEPDEAYHGVIYSEDGGRAPFALKMRAQMHRNIGACISALDAFLLIQGIETLALRMDRHVKNTRQVIEFLQGREEIAWISYPEMETSKDHELAEKYYPHGCGGIFSMGFVGGQETARKWMDHLQLISDVSNVADAKTLATHPASTTHQQLSEQARKEAGVPGEAVRMSIGLENALDIIEDMEQAFAALKEES